MANDPVPNKGFILSGSLYSKAKWAVAIVLPAISTLYFTLGSVWEWPNVEKVIGSIAAVTTFLGVVLGISTKSYNGSDAKYDGALEVGVNEDGVKVFSLNLNEDPEVLETMSSVMFKVDKE